MAYVILSRITCLEQLHLQQFDEKKIYCDRQAKEEAERLRKRALNLQKTEWDREREGVVRISTLNVRSLQAHRQDMEGDEFIMNSDILAIQETWLEADMATPFRGYHEFYVHGRSKGIALLTRVKPLNVVSFQTDCCSVILAQYENFDLINLYRFSSSTDVRQFTKDILPLINTTRVQIIVGDTNLDLLKNENNFFTQSLQNWKFVQKVSSSTHIQSGILDHIYFFTPRPGVSCTIYKLHPQYWSDHYCVSVCLNMAK